LEKNNHSLPSDHDRKLKIYKERKNKRQSGKKKKAQIREAV
jgi:hypothetical protein